MFNWPTIFTTPKMTDVVLVKAVQICNALLKAFFVLASPMPIQF